jgi:hypothetical protein
LLLENLRRLVNLVLLENLEHQLLPANLRLLENLVHLVNLRLLENLVSQSHLGNPDHPELHNHPVFLGNQLVLSHQVMKSLLYFDTMSLLLIEKVFSKIFLILHHHYILVFSLSLSN